MNYYSSFESKIGILTMVCDENFLLAVYFGSIQPENAEKKQTRLIERTEKQLKEYLSGKRKVFDVPLNPQGTEFQKRVWKALTEIPYGETRSYKDIAVKIGNPKACRAVGMANNRNPISILIPCHRVIGARGSLVGYGGGLDKKVQLLELENPGEVWKKY